MNTSQIFQEHNKEIRAIWSSFETNRPTRVPMVLGLSSRFFMLDRKYNPNRISYREYSADPSLMLEMQIRFEYIRRMTIPADYEMGLPEKGWEVNIDFQNYYEAAWLGSEIIYCDDQCPYSMPFLDDRNKNQLFYQGIPDSFSGFMGSARKYHEAMIRLAKTYSYSGIGVAEVRPTFIGSDGPFTLACSIRGPANICIDFYDDPAYVHSLMDFLTTATVQRIQDWRRYLDMPVLNDSFFFADDSIQLLSPEQYQEFVLPYHKRLCLELAKPGSGISVHLCGDASRHFRIMREQMGITRFDTGFPISHAEIVKELGPEIIIMGGPHIGLLQNASKEDVGQETRRILASVMPLTKKFILREANNMPPGTPLENIVTMYETCREYGRFDMSKLMIHEGR